MTDKFKNPLIGLQPADTFDRVNGMLDLLKSVDYAGRTCGPMPERAEIALMHCMDMMQDALKFEAGRAGTALKAAG